MMVWRLPLAYASSQISAYRGTANISGILYAKQILHQKNDFLYRNRHFICLIQLKPPLVE